MWTFIKTKLPPSMLALHKEKKNNNNEKRESGSKLLSRKESFSWSAQLYIVHRSWNNFLFVLQNSVSVSTIELTITFRTPLLTLIWLTATIWNFLQPEQILSYHILLWNTKVVFQTDLSNGLIFLSVILRFRYFMNG